MKKESEVNENLDVLFEELEEKEEFGWITDGYEYTPEGRELLKRYENQKRGPIC